MNRRPDKVLLTRRRWDVYMMPLFVAAAAIGVFQAWQTGQPRFALAPLGVIPLWIMLRLQTPREGMIVTTIRTTPGARVLLYFAAASLLSMAVLMAIDLYVFGHAFRAPLELYHVAMFAVPFGIMLMGAYLADRSRRGHDRRK